MFFRKKVKTYILDSTILADGRIIPLIEKEIFFGKFILVPQTSYLTIATDNKNESILIKRLNENLERIKRITKNKAIIHRKPVTKDELLKLAKKHNATIILANNEDKTSLMSNTSVSTKIPIITLNEIYEILKPDYLPGTELKVVVTKKGKEPDEGIGYLESGIKVVVTDGAKAMGKELEVVVIGSVETNVGKLIFAKPKYVEVK